MQAQHLLKAELEFKPELLQPAIKLNCQLKCCLDAALEWFEYGYNVIPVIPSAKLPAVKWDGWLKGLSNQKIREHWRVNPTHELGFIVGDDIIVLDADCQESLDALNEIENNFGVKPYLIVKTAKGEHHHFKRADDTVAKSDAHCTLKFPHRIDVKTGRAMVILPPSTDKTIAVITAKNSCDLTEVGQDFINAVYLQNGRNPPSTVAYANTSSSREANTNNNYLGVNSLLAYLDPNCGYDDWLRILMAIFHHTGGSDDGFEIANAWSSTSNKYKGENEIIAKWDSFDLDHPCAVTIGSLIKMVDNGYEIFHTAEESFSAVDDERAK